MPFEPGNKHGAKNRLFDGALKRAIAQDDGKRLRAAAEKLLDKAANGENWAIGMLAERLDGKADQTVNVNRSVESMSLAELAAAIADARAGGEPPAVSPDEPCPVH